MKGRHKTYELKTRFVARRGGEALKGLLGRTRNEDLRSSERDSKSFIVVFVGGLVDN